MNDQKSIIKLKDIISDEIYKGNIFEWKYFKDILDKKEIDEQIKKLLKKWFISINQPEFLINIPQGTEEIFIHHEDSCFIKTNKQVKKIHHDYTQNDINLVLNLISLKMEQNWSYSNPFCSFNYEQGLNRYRVTLVHHSVNPESVNKAFFRVIRNKAICLNHYSQHLMLKKFINDKKNILIAGSTGSGKTTLLNSMISIVNPIEHTVIIEDTYELTNPNERTSRLVAESKSLDTLLTYALRMSPERIILGEIRSNEVLTYILAMNTGHRGIMSSIHSNCAKDALHRLALLYITYAGRNISYELILKMICANIDYVIYMENKKIIEIIEVFGSEHQNIFYDEINKDLNSNCLIAQ